MNQVTYTKLLLEDLSTRYGPVSSSNIKALENVWMRLHILVALDFILSHAVMGPLVVGFWRGVWSYSQVYLDHQLCDGHLILSNGIAISAGLVGCILVYVFHHEMRTSAGSPGSLKHTLISRCFSVWFGFFHAYLWKGVWHGINVVFVDTSGSKLDWKVSIICMCIGLLGLTISGTCHSGTCSPTVMEPDLLKDHISASTLLRSDQTKTWFYRLIDGIFTNVIVLMSSIAWYGVWTLEDILLEEYLGWSHVESSVATVILGIALDLLVVILQQPLLRMCNKTKSEHDASLLHFIAQAANSLKAVISIISVSSSFRGLWYLWDIFYLADYPSASFVTGGVLGAAGLMVMGCINSLHGDVKWDDIRVGGVTLPCYYITYFYILNVKTEQQNDEGRS